MRFVKSFPGQIDKGGAASKPTFSWYRQRIPKRLSLVSPGSDDGSGLFFYFIR
jgi:hypothetical protein